MGDAIDGGDGGVSVATASWDGFSALLQEIYALAFGVTSERGKDPDGELARYGREKRKHKPAYNPTRPLTPSTGQTQIRASPEGQVPPQELPRRLYSSTWNDVQGAKITMVDDRGAREATGMIMQLRARDTCKDRFVVSD